MCASRSYFTNFSKLPSPRSSRVHSHEWTRECTRERRAESARIYLSCVLLSTFCQKTGSHALFYDFCRASELTGAFPATRPAFYASLPETKNIPCMLPGFTMSLNYRLWYHFVRSYTRETGSIRASTEEIARLDVEAGSLFINWPGTRNKAGDILLERCTSVYTI